MDAKFWAKINPPEKTESESWDAYHDRTRGMTYYHASVSYSSVKLYCSISIVQDKEYTDLYVSMKGSSFNDQPTTLQATTEYRADIIADIVRRIEGIDAKLATMDETTRMAFVNASEAYIEAREVLKQADEALSRFDHYARKEITESYFG
jgi:predicted FMN-binding regulatory protein PaiB